MIEPVPEAAGDQAYEATREREELVGELSSALEHLRWALESLHAAGVPVVEAFREAGVEIPSFVAPMVERAFSPR